MMLIARHILFLKSHIWMGLAGFGFIRWFGILSRLWHDMSFLYGSSSVFAFYEHLCFCFHVLLLSAWFGFWLAKVF